MIGRAFLSDADASADVTRRMIAVDAIDMVAAGLAILVVTASRDA